jgi:hypothetical protein
MPVRITGTGADDRQARTHGAQEVERAGRPTAVMGDLEHVDRPVAFHLCREQCRIDLLLGVAHQQHPARTEGDVEDDRHVVDALAVVRGRQRHRVRERPPHGHSSGVEGEAAAGGQPDGGPAQTGQGVSEGPIARPARDHPRLRQDADAVSLQQQRQAGRVVLVWVGQDDEIDASIPGRDPLVEDREQAIRVGPGVDEDPTASVACEEDRVALPDVEHGHRESPIGARDRDDPDEADRAREDRDREARPEPALSRVLR